MSKKTKNKKEEKPIDPLRQLRRLPPLDLLLLGTRNVFLNGVVNQQSSLQLVKELTYLDILSPDPIVMRINSPGGSIVDGISIIDAMQYINAPVITLISGYACSMGALISVCGVKRLITRKSIWMIHPPVSGMGDYFSFIKDRMVFINHLEKIGLDILSKHTKMTKKEIKQSLHGELWYNAKKCQSKKIVDKIMG